ncbi:MAG: CBS domain-containing protein [Gammaproteobacteria bacterium]|nr:CBS domain-containing protein [Gammaproteobacteria bacterium]
MQTAKQLLEGKGRQVWSVHSDATVYDALQLMAQKEIGALVVIDDGKMVGLVSERDYARKVILQGRSSRDTAVAEIMSTKVLHITPEQTVNDCMALMTDKKIRHLPVLVNDQIIGILSIGDLVKAIIAEQEFVIDQLEHYISGSPA